MKHTQLIKRFQDIVDDIDKAVKEAAEANPPGKVRFVISNHIRAKATAAISILENDAKQPEVADAPVPAAPAKAPAAPAAKS